MTRMKLFLGALAIAVIVAAVPAAHAQKQSCLGSVNSPNCFVHVVGAGSSAQFLTSAIGADDLANQLAISLTNGGTPSCSFHWTANSAGNLVDTRSGLIPLEPANMWVVWVASQDGATCAASVGNTDITDIWLDASVDSTVGNRAFFAQTAQGSGVAVELIPVASGGLIATGLWPDDRADVSILAGGATNIPKAIGTDQTGIVDVHVNVGMTDIRSEDALYATTRAFDALNSTLTGLGYGIKGTCPGSTTKICIGNSILTSRGTGTKATPVAFATSGADPFTGDTVRGFFTVPLGAAPIIFMYNNNNIGEANNPVLNLVTGVKGTGSAGGPYNAAHLYDGTTNCADNNAAFTGNAAGSGVGIHLYLREPLSGTMNTTEFNVFRTTGNTNDSQEKGVDDSTNNPLSGLACGSGDRNRVIGTGEARDAVKNVANGFSYQFFGFANMAKYGGNTTYNYLTVDGNDPFGGSSLANTAQTPPNCAGPSCTQAGEWGGTSFPTLRNGTYQVWSTYRWISQFDLSTETDTYGPAHLAQDTQSQVDNTVADFVPFVSQNCEGGTAPNNDGAACLSNAQCTASGGGTAGTCQITDSLDVYRSHFAHPLTTSPASNGDVSAAGDSLGGDGEEGGDEGGVIYGPFPATGNVKCKLETTGAFTGDYGCTLVTGSGPKFSIWAATASGVSSAAGNTVTVDGANYTIAAGNSVTSTTFYITSYSGALSPTAVAYSYDAQTPGILKKKR